MAFPQLSALFPENRWHLCRRKTCMHLPWSLLYDPSLTSSSPLSLHRNLSGISLSKWCKYSPDERPPLLHDHLSATGCSQIRRASVFCRKWPNLVRFLQLITYGCLECRASFLSAVVSLQICVCLFRLLACIHRAGCIQEGSGLSSPLLLLSGRCFLTCRPNMVMLCRWISWSHYLKLFGRVLPAANQIQPWSTEILCFPGLAWPHSHILGYELLTVSSKSYFWGRDSVERLTTCLVTDFQGPSFPKGANSGLAMFHLWRHKFLGTSIDQWAWPTRDWESQLYWGLWAKAEESKPWPEYRIRKVAPLRKNHRECGLGVLCFNPYQAWVVSTSMKINPMPAPWQVFKRALELCILVVKWTRHWLPCIWPTNV